MFTAELDHLLNPAHSQPRTFRTRLVVQTAMQHAAIVAALVPACVRLLFQNRDVRIRHPLLYSERSSQSDDAAPHHHDAHKRSFSPIGSLMQRYTSGFMDRNPVNQILERELEYHEKLYAGFAQEHFARPAVRALRAHMVKRVLAKTGAGRQSRVLSLGCGIGDTELLLASHVREVVGVDLSPAAVRQATQDAASAGITNARFEEGSLEAVHDKFDVVIAIFLLHHLPDAILNAAPALIRERLTPGGKFYSLDPSRQRLSGMVGSILFPRLMEKYQSPDERQLDPEESAEYFRSANFACRTSMYDFVSSPLAGLFPGWRTGYLAARALDELLIRTPGLNRLGSNFELLAWPS
jgi:cyclopropane fatty-acyl-phospholipid synthase-like methyltransferase